MMSHKGVSRTGAAADLDMLVLVNGKRYLAKKRRTFSR